MTEPIKIHNVIDFKNKSFKIACTESQLKRLKFREVDGVETVTRKVIKYKPKPEKFSIACKNCGQVDGYGVIVGQSGLCVECERRLK